MTRIIKYLSIALVLFIVSIWLLLFLWKAPPLYPTSLGSRAVYDRHHQLLRLTLSADGKYRLWVPLKEFSPHLVEATLLEEDQYFYWHFGVNPISLIKAGWKTYIIGARRIGASTLTMQVARIRFQINTKTFIGKCEQIFRALQLEIHYTKQQLLEAYLNIAPYGNNIEGAGAASLIYFAKPVLRLSLPQALALAVVPQNPTQRVVNKEKLKSVRNKLYLRWLNIHPEDSQQKPLMDLPLQMRLIHAVPFLAPHFVNEVLEDPAITAHSIQTTLDLSLQKMIEKTTRLYLARKQHLGACNAAVLLIDTRDMGIRAMLGSAGFFNIKISGQINGTAIKRSPGSTLKPFIYALAIDQGLIHPATVLKDVPYHFGSYDPENFDNDFDGPLSAKEALILSRNIPAIALANQLKGPSLYDFLLATHVRDLKAESYYGLALVLGGVELTMQELTGLYAMLVNEGVWQPLHYIDQEQRTNGPSFFVNSDDAAPPMNAKKILSPEAAFLVLDMLKDAPMPGFYWPSAEAKALSVSWKTGTSSRFRDAWSVGVIGPYVLAVWVGNFNNQSNPILIGKEIAAPLMFEIINALRAEIGPLATVYSHPEKLHLVKTEVCKASGMLPTRYCTDREKVWFIPGKSPIQTDTIYREIAINTQTGLRACHFDQHTRFAVYEFWSSDLLKIFKTAGIERRVPPPYDKDCVIGSKPNDGFSPQIISPQTEVNYVVRLHAIKQTWVPLSAVVDADVNNVYWFINGSYLGKSPREKALLWRARPGKFVVRVVDDAGRSDVRELNIRVES